MALWSARHEAAEAHRDDCQTLPPSIGHSAVIIPLGAAANAVDTGARRERPLARNWVGAEADFVSREIGVEVVDCGKYSRGCTYTRYEYRGTLRSCGVCKTGQLHYWIGATSRRLKSPRGWQFGRDQYGMYIVRKRERRANYRYHFTSLDVTSVSTIRAAAIAHEAAQKRAAVKSRERARMAREQTILASKTAREGQEAIDDGHVFVGLRDSSRAGNCAAGTQAWARQRGLDASKRYPARVILRAAAQHGDDWQVQRAVESAIDRTLIDLHRGYCTL